MTASEKSGMSRRNFVRTSAIGVALAATANGVQTGVAEAATANVTESLAGIPYVGAGSNTAVRPFWLHQITLNAGLLQEKRDRMKAFLGAFDERRFLFLFNNQAGRPNPAGVTAPGGWEDGGLLSGHWAGHYMSALAQAYADQGEASYKTKLDWMVTELGACQDAITARMTGTGGPTEPEALPIGRVAGKFGNALKLNGGSNAEHIKLPQEAVSQLTNFTIATWVHLAAAQSWSRVFDFGQSTAVNMFLTARSGATGNAPRFAITTTGTGGEQQINGTTAIPTGQWVHLAVSLSGAVGTLYVNGVVAGTNTNMTLNPTNLGVPGNVWIGRSAYGDAMLNASIDEFHIFDRALTPEEITSLQTSAAGTTGGGNIAWYKFDETDGASAVDSSPNNRPAGIVAIPQSGGQLWKPVYAGYLGAIPEDAVIRVGPPRYAQYGGNAATNVWAPWYTQHKIIRGLLDAYTLTGNTKAREIVVKMADWAHNALTTGDKNHANYAGPITRDNLNLMWDTYIAGELGGVNEVFAEIHALTGDPKHLETAKLFDNRESLFGATVENRDILTVTNPTAYGRRRPARLHVNQHVPGFSGYMRIFEQGGGDDYLKAAKNFFGMLVPHRMFTHGGLGGNYPGSNNNIEMFQNRDNIANAIAQGGAETCSIYNVSKLARNLFFHTQDPAYMDYYERALFNQLAGSRADSTSVSNPQVTYFQPLTPGAGKSYGNTGTCCGGTGLEIHTKYQEAAYFKSADGSALWVNLFVPSTVNWTEKNFTLTQETSFPRQASTKLTVTGSGQLDIKLRVPKWAVNGYTVKINGVTQLLTTPVPGTYVTLSRNWSNGDTIDIAFPFSIHIERAIDRPDTQSIMWGPLLMPILGNPGGGAYRELTLYRHLKRDGDYSRAAVTAAGVNAAGDPLFTTSGFNLRPWYVGDTQAHSAYFRRVEPKIVFGGVDSGVPNVKRNDALPNYDVPVTGIVQPGTDGPTFLDLLWDNAPFATHAAFMAKVGSTADAFVAAGTLTAEQKAAIVAAADNARAELSPEAEIPVTVTPESRTIAGSAYLAVRVVNDHDAPVDVVIETAYGRKAFIGVAPGKSAFQQFAVRAAQFPAGEVTVTVTGTVDGDQVTTEIVKPYAAS